MDDKVSTSKLMMAIFSPAAMFSTLAESAVPPASILFRYSIWLLLLPPLFLLIGGYGFGWHIGADHPIELSNRALIMASAGYFVALSFGFVSTVLISRWMAITYSAKSDLGAHIALISIVGAPLAVASAIHILPHIVINLLTFIPALIWSMYLLYTGIPVVLQTTPEKGMLMASSLVGWLLVAAVSLLGITLGLWVLGFGPSMGV